MSGFLTNFIKGIISPSSSSKNSKSGRGGAKKSSNRQKKQQNAKNTKDDDDDENSSSSDNLSDIGNESEDNSIDKDVYNTPTDNVSAVPKRGRGRPKKENSAILAEYEKAGKKASTTPKPAGKGKRTEYLNSPPWFDEKLQVKNEAREQREKTREQKMADKNEAKKWFKNNILAQKSQQKIDGKLTLDVSAEPFDPVEFDRFYSYHWENGEYKGDFIRGTEKERLGLAKQKTRDTSIPTTKLTNKFSKKGEKLAITLLEKGRNLMYENKKKLNMRDCKTQLEEIVERSTVSARNKLNVATDAMAFY